MVEKQSLWEHIKYSWEMRQVAFALVCFFFGFLISQGQQIIGLEFLGYVGWGLVVLLASIFFSAMFLACFYYFKEAKYTNDQLNEMFFDYAKKMRNKKGDK